MNMKVLVSIGVCLTAAMGCTDPSGLSSDSSLSDVSPSFLFGGVASISLEKSTNGLDADEAPGPAITPGDPVQWEYRVTNTGTEALNSVYVVDDMEGFICTIGDLAPGQVEVCTWQREAQAGPYANVGTVYGSAFLASVQASDPSHYMGDESGGDPPEGGSPESQTAEIKIKPGSPAPCINPRSKGRTPVAILASADFNPLGIDPNTIMAGGSVSPIKWGKGEDVNHDALLDLVVHFLTQDLFHAGLLQDGTELEISGELLDGGSFLGSDLVHLTGSGSCK